MRHKTILAVILILLFAVPLFWEFETVKDSEVEPDFFVGIDTAYDNVEDIEKLVDSVKGYTNLFVIGSTGITLNRTKLDQVCQYIYGSGLYFIVYSHPPPNNEINQTQWVADAKQRWGDRFMGIYLIDESGGRQIDVDEYRFVEEADNYTDAANKYVETLDGVLKTYTEDMLKADGLSLFTGDYALYWFDYETRFDAVLSEFGWNHSRLLNVALDRGAAEMHNKDWGVVITWTYWDAPYIESPNELYYDMLYAYLNGAKYVIVFNYSKDRPAEYGTLSNEHLEAIERFWDFVKDNPREEVINNFPSRVAYVLPKDYAWGFRGKEDKIWGLWVDEYMSTVIGTDVNYLLHADPMGLDIIYDDPKYYDNMKQYNKLIFWNGTIT